MPFTALAALAAFAAPNGPIRVPEISFAHTGQIERYCEEVSSAKPDPTVLAEIDARVGEFAAAWAKGGPILMRETVKLTGRPYPFREALATLHGCPDMATMGIPLVVNVIRFTHAYTLSTAPLPRLAVLGTSAPEGPRVVRPLSDFVHDVWYEVTRRYVRAIRQQQGNTTPLLQKYGKESFATQRNLHLVALDQLVSDRLGTRADFERRQAAIRARGAKDLVRAYDIVRQEGAEKFLAELRAR